MKQVCVGEPYNLKSLLIFFSNFSSDEESSQVFIPFVSDVKVGTEAMPGPSSLELEDTIGKFYKLTIILSNLNIFICLEKCGNWEICQNDLQGCWNLPTSGGGG